VAKRPRTRRPIDTERRERFWWEEVFMSTLRALVEKPGDLGAPVTAATLVADAALAAYRERYGA
jgi:hypothetical protein